MTSENKSATTKSRLSFFNQTFPSTNKMYSKSNESLSAIEEYLMNLEQEEETWKSLLKEAQEKHKCLKTQLQNVTPISKDLEVLGEMNDECLRNRVNIEDVINKMECFQKKFTLVNIQVNEYQHKVQCKLNQLEQGIDALVSAVVEKPSREMK